MNWEFAWEVVCRLATAVYSAGLLAIGFQMLRAQPGVRRDMSAHAAALTAHANALTLASERQDKLEQIAVDVAEIKAARVVDLDLLDRVYRALEQCEAERSGARARAVR